jgi:hypothetical protein
MDLTVVNVPKLGALAFWVPLAKLVTYRKDTFFSTGLFLITTGTAYTGIKFMLGNGRQEEGRLFLAPAP